MPRTLRALAASGLIAIAAVILPSAAGVAGAAAPALPLPPPPTLPPVAVPDALKPVLGVAGPTVAPVCGLAGLVPGLLGEEAGSLPFDPRPVVPYLAPLLVVCGTIPIPTTTHTCTIDNLVDDQIRGIENKVLSLLGVLPLPAPEGIAIDTLDAVDAAAGNAVPSDVIGALATGLGCASSAVKPPGGSAKPVTKPVPPPVPVASPVADAQSLVPVTAPPVVPTTAPPAPTALAGPSVTVITRPAGTQVIGVAQHWHPVITVLLVLALSVIGGWAWRAERRDARNWNDRGGAV